jgi:muramoyltetrapeptide carboxypeptidase LdcA involved in peptidoglycan recycling
VLREAFGFKIKEFPTARMSSAELHDNPRKRADDINAAFADSEVDGIICSIGGDDSIRILKYLDLELIRKNHKFIMGYSDSTTFLGYLNLNGLATYYGSSVMAGFGYLGCFDDALAEYKRALFTDLPYELAPFAAWADRYASWGAPENAGKVFEVRRDDIGFRWLQKGPATSGRLWGGCVEVLDMMNGTFAWPSGEFWNDKILMLETSEDKPTPAYVGYILRNFGIQGILQRIKGLLVAKPKGYSSDEKRELDEEILRIAVGEFECRDLNIVTNVEFGHTEPRHIMPLGIEMRIDPASETLAFTEPLFA